MSTEPLNMSIERLVRSGPHWSPHPDIAGLVPRDEQWGNATVAVADLRSALDAARAAQSRETLLREVWELYHDCAIGQDVSYPSRPELHPAVEPDACSDDVCVRVREVLRDAV